MDFEKIIAESGVKVVTWDLPRGWWGAYDRHDHRIILRPRLGVVQYGSTLAHELSHAWHMHRGTTPRQEREASVWAVRRLIRPSAFADAVPVSEHPAGIPQILGVMPSDVDTYIATLAPNEILLIRNLIRKEEVC